MNILIVARGIPNKHDPQEGCFEFDQAKAIAALGHEVSVICVDSRVRKFWRKIGITKQKIGNINTFKLFIFPTSIIRHLISYKLGYKIESYFASYLYKKVSRKLGPFDIVHSHFLSCTYYASMIKRKNKCKLVATEHWSELDKNEITSLVRFLGEKTYPYVDTLITVSESLKRNISLFFNKDSVVIHNLIDAEYLKSPVSNNDDICKIVCVGSLVRRKGFDFLIKAIYESKIYDKNFMLRIIGNGPERNNLQNLILSCGLEDKIQILGQMSKQDIYGYLHESDFFILPSRHENFSVAVLEALANGLPVIATICGGIRECIDDNNGILVDVDDINGMASALQLMYENRGKYDKEMIQKECLKRYSPSSICEQIISLYSKIVDNKNYV